MIRRILYFIVALPIALIVAFGALNFLTAVLGGNGLLWLNGHRAVLGVFIGILLIRYFSPFKNRRRK